MKRITVKSKFLDANGFQNTGGGNSHRSTSTCIGIASAVTPSRRLASLILIALLTLCGVGEMWGDTWLYGTMQSTAWSAKDNNYKFTYDGSVGSYEIELAASTEYEFKIIDNGGGSDAYYSMNNSNFTNTTTDYLIYTGNSNCKITTGEAGIYIFKTWWADNNRHFAVYFPQARLEKGSYLYVDARNTNWVSNEGVGFGARYFYKYYDSGTDLPDNSGVLDCTTPLEYQVHYTIVPNNDYVGQVMIERKNPADMSATRWDYAQNIAAFSRSSSKQNCLSMENATGETWSNFSPVWTTYCPIKATSTISDNGTTTYGGNGEESTPYLVEKGTTIKLSASSTDYISDPNMTTKYNFCKDDLTAQDTESSTYQFTASSSAGTNHKINVNAYNYYNSTSSTEKFSTLLFYRTVTCYTVTYNANSGTGAVPASPTKYKAGDNITVLGAGTLERSGYTFIGWNTATDGTGTHYDVGATITSIADDVVLYAQWVSLTTPTVTPASTNWGGADININLSVTSTGLTDAIVVFYVADGSNSTTYEVMAAPGVAGANNTIVHTATFAAQHAATYTVTAKLYTGKFIDNFEASATYWTSTGYGAYEKVSNVEREANNGSSTIMKITRKDAEYNTAYTSTAADNATKTDWGYTYDYIHMRYYAPQAETPKVQYVDKYPTYKNTTLSSVSANTWHKLDFLVDGGTVDLIFPFVTSGDNKSIYIDDVFLSNESTPTVLITSASANTTIIDTYTVTLNTNGGTINAGNVTSYTYGTGATLPTNVTKDGKYLFGGWYDNEELTGDPVTTISTTDYGNKEYWAEWLDAYDITWMVNGVAYTTGLPTVRTSTRAGITTLPTNPADNTLSCANSFRGWSETNIGGEATDTQPADLFATTAGAPTIDEDKTFYAVFGTAASGTPLVGTVLWSEDWTGETTGSTPTSPSSSGGYGIEGATINYTWQAATGSGAATTSVTTASGGNLAGGSSPEAIIAKKGTDGNNGALLISGLPRKGAKELTLTFKRNANSLTPTISSSGTAYSISPVSGTGKDTYVYTITCGSAETFTLILTAGNSANVRLDDIVLTIKTDGATGYRTRCPALAAEVSLVTASTPIFITSSASKMVRSQDSIRITGSNLSKNATVTISSPASKFALKSRKNGALTTDASGSIDTVAYIFYTPDAGDTSDGLDNNASFTISVGGNGAKDVVVNQALIGRHLPANFVIAAKSGGTWYALPSNNTYSDNGNPTPVAIKVDDTTNPTKVITADANVYTLYAQTNTVTNGGNGQYIKLAMHGQSNAPLYTYNNESAEKIGKSGTAVVTNDLSGIRWWLLTQTNTSVSSTTDVKYTIKSGTGNTKPLSIKSNKWGLYAAGEGVISELRLIPWYAAEFEATVTEWTNDDLEITTTNAPSTISATQVATDGAVASSVEDISEDATTHTVAFDATNFTGHKDEILILKWLDSEDNLVAASFVTMPGIITTSATAWGSVSSTIDDVVVLTGNMVVSNTGNKAKRVVLEGGSLTINAGKQLIVAETVRKFDGGAFGATDVNDIVIKSDASNGLGALVMGTHDGTNGATVNFYSKSHGTKNSNTSVNQYVGTPFGNHPAMLNQFYNSWMYKIGTNELTNLTWERINGDTPLEAFQGYNVISADNEMNPGHMYEMQGTLVTSDNQTLDELYCITTASEGTIMANNENLLANSWMAPIKIKEFDEEDFNSTIATIYIFNATSPSAFSFAGNYSAYPINSAGETDVIPAMQAFSVFTYGSNGETEGSVTLDYSRLVYDPAVGGTVPTANKAPRRVQVEANEANKIRLFVSAESGYGDMLYMWENSQFDEGFENGWDGHKIAGEAVAPQLYAVTPDGNMAVNCVPTFEGAVVGFQAGSNDNQYTFSFEADETAEALYLYDTETEQYTLISGENTYTFSTTDKAAHNRFLLTRDSQHIYTGIEPTGGGGGKVDKRLIDNHLYILRGGRTYDATGRRIQ
ncbi:MAG: InlB B-repeat-containing protein [Paludibacteraceae bacterium]|nr:InlB B-repeat-containing protein [Paludibacteraceae bacterium]